MESFNFATIGKIWHKIPKRFRSKKVLALIALVLLSSFYLTRGAPDKSKIRTEKAQIKDISQTVTASGSIKPKTTASLRFASGGKIAFLLVKDGDRVTAGKTLGALQSEPFNIALRKAQQEVTAADAILSQIYDEQKKQTQAENFDQKIKRTSAETAKNKAFDDLKKAERDLRESVLVSPIDGIVTDVSVVAGQDILATTEVLKVVQSDQIAFTAEVDESQIGDVKEGIEAAVTLDAFDENPVKSTVSFVSPTPVTTSTGSIAYEVKIMLPTDPKYKLGLSGEAEITTKKVFEKLVIPLESIVDEKFVYVKMDSIYQKKEVGTGLSSDTEIEIVSGLDENSIAVTSGFDQLDKKTNLQKIIGALKR